MTISRIHNPNFNSKQKGFALLLTLVVISVVLAIGLSLLNITVKQFTLSATIRDSEIAFHAANTGIECVQYAVLKDGSDFFDGGNVPGFDCGAGTYMAFGTPTEDNINVNQGTMYKYTYQFSSPGQCIDVSMYAIASDGTGDMNVSFANEGLSTGDCANSSQCTYVFSRGHNRSCDQLSSLRVVQREIAVDF